MSNLRPATASSTMSSVFNALSWPFLSEDRSSVLMLRRHRFVTDEIGWELPGGIVDAGESGLEAAARETLEETGYEASAGRLLAAFQPMIGMVDTPHEVYLFEESQLVSAPSD